MSNERIGREAAEEYREKLGLGTRPVGNLARLIENELGIGVAYVQGAEPGHGMTMSDGLRTLIAAGCTPHPLRMRSTLAHELGHVVLQSVDRYLHDQEIGERDSREIQADAFARHFLLPLAAVEKFADGRQVSERLLSDLVQTFGVSAHMAAIQMRDLGLINSSTFEEWKSLSGSLLSTRYGWPSEYEVQALESSTARPPQDILARTMEGYRWGAVSAAAIARLSGESNVSAVSGRLQTEGIIPGNARFTAAEAPTDSGARLTAEELKALMGNAETKKLT